MGQYHGTGGRGENTDHVTVPLTDLARIDGRQVPVAKERFDEVGHRISNELVTDPATVVQACAWRDLAVHYAAPDNARSAAA
ncbi:DUF6879 family protein [Micromonospora sp. SL4-19]|uniref:DUF6879 family protein n=1 Tax=Micromonospora sp. SL4-19 TaxID=3399129 RepID=UPI003A4E5A9E